MREIIYAKYNRNRKKQFQIATVIAEENGQRFAEKYAITDPAQLHLDHMQSLYPQLEGQYTNLEILQGTVHESRVRCDYVEGLSVSNLLETALKERNTESFLQYVSNITEEIFSYQVQLTDFVRTERFTEVFGEVDMTGKSLPVTNIDLIFDNVLVQDGRYICLDYEWLFDFPIPADFVKFRSLHYFYAGNAAALQNNFSEEKFLYACGIEAGQIQDFALMEENFKKWVFGEEDYLANYFQPFDTLEDKESLINNMDQHIRNIEPGYQKWVRLMSMPPIKAGRRVYHLLKGGNRK